MPVVLKMIERIRTIASESVRKIKTSETGVLGKARAAEIAEKAAKVVELDDAVF